MSPFLCALFVLVYQAFVSADKDSRYYPPGASNPNTANKYYWKNAINVMQDLDQFESLYVEYHGCVWSRYGYGDGCDDAGQANQDDDEHVNEFYWYLRRTICFRSNVAFVLYGTLKEDSDDLGCHKDRYIKSFFTEWGPESFAQPLGIDTSVANSNCNVYNERRWLEDKYNIYGDDAKYQFQDDDYWKNQYEYPYYSDQKMSYTTGCSVDRKFVLHKFQGSFCDGNNIVGQIDSLDTFNEEIESLGCSKIYSASDNDQQEHRSMEQDQNQDQDQNQNEGENQDQKQENYQDDDSVLSFDDPLGIIMNSDACLLNQYRNECPDPYGKLQTYTNLLNDSTQGKPVNRNVTRLKNSISLALTSLAIIMLILTLFIRTKKKHNSKSSSEYENRMEKVPRKAHSNPFIQAGRGLSHVFQQVTEIEEEEEEDTTYEPPSPEMEMSTMIPHRVPEHERNPEKASKFVSSRQNTHRGEEADALGSAVVTAPSLEELQKSESVSSFWKEKSRKRTESKKLADVAPLASPSEPKSAESALVSHNQSTTGSRPDVPVDDRAPAWTKIKHAEDSNPHNDNGGGNTRKRIVKSPVIHPKFDPPPEVMRDEEITKEEPKPAKSTKQTSLLSSTLRRFKR